jgi:hypothetical protein
MNWLVLIQIVLDKMMYEMVHQEIHLILYMKNQIGLIHLMVDVLLGI